MARKTPAEIHAILLAELQRTLPTDAKVEPLDRRALDATLDAHPELTGAREELLGILSADPKVVDLSFHPMLVRTGLVAPALAVLLMGAAQTVNHRVKLYPVGESLLVV